VQAREIVLHSAVEPALALRGRPRLDERVVAALHPDGEIERDVVAGLSHNALELSGARAGRRRLHPDRREERVGLRERGIGKDGRAMEVLHGLLLPGSAATSTVCRQSSAGFWRAFVESRRNWTFMAQSPAVTNIRVAW